MTRYEEIKHCEESAKNYDNGEFDLYDAEMGYESWMDSYISNDDSITAEEHYSILSVQAQAWNNTHKNDYISEQYIRNKSM